jgi:hypothetical protein
MGLGILQYWVGGKNSIIEAKTYASKNTPYFHLVVEISKH